MKRRKDEYVGPWLPEPRLTAPDVGEDAELAESMSMALMVVLEMLSPTERAIFVLREAFDVGYDEIAAAVGKSPAAVRQIAHRARRHVDARRLRGTASFNETRVALESFQRAFETGDLQGLLEVLAPEVVFVSDDGGVKRTAVRPIAGAEKVVRALFGGFGKVDGTFTGEPTVVNGNPALLVRLDGGIDGIIAVRVKDARITGLYYVRNPDKLTRVGSETPLTLRGFVETGIGGEAERSMRLPANEHTDRLWRIHEIAPGFRVEDVWACRTLGAAPDEFSALLDEMRADGGPDQNPPLVRLLFAVLWKLSALFSWDKPEEGFVSRVASLRDRLPRDLRGSSAGEAVPSTPFTAVYALLLEAAFELANKTVHDVLHLGWVPSANDEYELRLAALFKPNGLFGRLYMAGIAPFRYLIVYPALTRQLERA